MAEPERAMVEALMTFVDQNQAAAPGTFIHNRPGSSHRPGSPDGCTFLAVVTARPRPAPAA